LIKLFFLSLTRLTQFEEEKGADDEDEYQRNGDEDNFQESFAETHDVDRWRVCIWRETKLVVVE